MTLIPQRTVASQLAAKLRAEIANGTWHGWLPSERALGETLQASRNTIRAALRQLRREGTVSTVPGVGNRIPEPRPKKIRHGRPGRTLGVLIPEPVDQLRPVIPLSINEIKDQLLQEDCRTTVHEGLGFYQAKPQRALERLIQQHRHDAWLLWMSSEPMQRWFHARGVPCLIGGSAYPAFDLPFVDIDFRAVCRHAAGVLIGHGHRRIALINRESRCAGDLGSEQGFCEGARASGHAEVETETVYHHDDVESVARALGQLLGRAKRPTGLVVSHSYSYLSVVSILAQRGLTIPQDISVISRDDDSFLRFLAPAPARYVCAPRLFARKAAGQILQLMNAGTLPHRQTLLLPKFFSGGSVSAPVANG